MTVTLTTKEVVTDALEDILEQSADEPVAAADGAAGIRYLNDMMFMWASRGMDLGFTRVSDMGDAVTVNAGAVLGIKAHLSILLATKFNAEITPSLITRAKLGWKAILRLTGKSVTMSYPSILPTGSGNYNKDYTFYTEVDPVILTDTGGLVALEIDV